MFSSHTTQVVLGGRVQGPRALWGAGASHEQARVLREKLTHERVGPPPSRWQSAPPPVSAAAHPGPRCPHPPLHLPEPTACSPPLLPPTPATSSHRPRRVQNTTPHSPCSDRPGRDGVGHGALGQGAGGSPRLLMAPPAASRQHPHARPRDPQAPFGQGGVLAVQRGQARPWL